MRDSKSTDAADTALLVREDSLLIYKPKPAGDYHGLSRFSDTAHKVAVFFGSSYGLLSLLLDSPFAALVAGVLGVIYLIFLCRDISGNAANRRLMKEKQHEVEWVREKMIGSTFGKSGAIVGTSNLIKRFQRVINKPQDNIDRENRYFIDSTNQELVKITQSLRGIELNLRNFEYPLPVSCRLLYRHGVGFFAMVISTIRLLQPLNNVPLRIFLIVLLGFMELGLSGYSYLSARRNDLSDPEVIKRLRAKYRLTNQSLGNFKNLIARLKEPMNVNQYHNLGARESSQFVPNIINDQSLRVRWVFEAGVQFIIGGSFLTNLFELADLFGFNPGVVGLIIISVVSLFQASFSANLVHREYRGVMGSKTDISRLFGDIEQLLSQKVNLSRLEQAVRNFEENPDALADLQVARLSPR